MVFSVICRVVQPLPQSRFGIFPTPSKKLCTYFQSLFNSQGEATTNLFSMSIDLLFQTFNIKHNDSVHCMIFYMWFTERNGFELIPVAACIFPLYCWVVFHGISWMHHTLVATYNLVGMWDVYTFELLWILLPWTFTSKFYVQICFHVSWVDP